MSLNSQLNKLKEILSQEFSKQECAVASCNQEHCITPWHKPCMLAKYELADKLWPMLALVGSLEIVVGTILVILMVLYGNDYDVLYGTEDSKGEGSKSY